MLIEGIVIAPRSGGQLLIHLHPRRVRRTGRRARCSAATKRREAGFVGEDILGSGHSLHWSCTSVPAPTSAARRPALLDSLKASAATRGPKPPFPPARASTRARPLINNVETLSTVPTIIATGGEEYAKLGMAELDRNQARVWVSGHVQRPGNYEIELGIPSREIIYGLAGGPPEGRRVKCWFPGGSSSAAVLTDDDLDLPLRLRRAWPRPSSMLGSGAIIVIDDSTDDRRHRAEGRRSSTAHESLRQVHPVPRGHELDREDARARSTRARPTADLDLAHHGRRSRGPTSSATALCVLGRRVWRSPIGCDVAKFRDEFEAQHRGGTGAHVELATAPDGRSRAAEPWSSSAAARDARCRRSDERHRHDRRPSRCRRRDDAMLVDAAKQPATSTIPRLLLPAQARAAGRRVPHVPASRSRASREAARLGLLDAGQGRHGRSSTAVQTASSARSDAIIEFLLDQPPARLPGVRPGRRVPAAGHLASAGAAGARASSSRSATSQKPLALSAARSRSTVSAASSATAACASPRRSPRTTS